jgi:hypothetical protein
VYSSFYCPCFLFKNTSSAYDYDWSFKNFGANISKSSALNGIAIYIEQGLCASIAIIFSISIGELLSGFKGGNREEENRKELEEFLDAPHM